MTISNKELNEMQELYSKTTQGEWMWWDSCSWRRLGTTDQTTRVMVPTVASDGHPDLYFPNSGYRGPDGTFIAHSHQDMPRLIAEVRRLRSRLKLAEKHLRDFNNIDTDVVGQFRSHDDER